MTSVSRRIIGLVFATFAAVLTSTLHAESGGSTALRIELTGLQSVEGSLYIAVYDSADTWLGEGALQQHKVVVGEAREGELVTTALLLPPGEYALSIFYDANGNGELDTNFIGIPKEPIALSNNARPKFGPPKYKDAVFTVGSAPLTQRIDMAGM
jgi:uncharacterized protein (DUF2141 family)